MEQTWIYRNIERAAPIPEPILPYVEAIGVELTARLLLSCGGSFVSLPSSRVISDSLLTEAIGAEPALALGKTLSPGSIKIPLGKSFLTRHLTSQGYGQQEICRTLHCDLSTVGRILNGGVPAREAGEKRRAEA